MCNTMDGNEVKMNKINEEFILKKAVEFSSEILRTNDISKLSFVPIKGGITNLIYRISSKESDVCVLARFYGDKSEYIVNRERERAIGEALSKIGLTKKIYGYFEGGQIEEWIDGTSMSDDGTREPTNMIRIAKIMRTLHNVPLCDDFYKIDDVAKYMPADYYGKSIIFAKIRLFYHTVTSKHDDLKAGFSEYDFEKIKEDIDILERICNKTNSPVVLGHGDLLPPNVIKVVDGVRFIDFEYSCPMERGFDIANHLMEYIGFDVDLSKLPTRHEENLFLSHYLNSSLPNEIDDLRREIRPFYMTSNLFWGLWSLFQHFHSSVDFGFGDYAKKKLDLFLNPDYRNMYGWYDTTC